MDARQEAEMMAEKIGKTIFGSLMTLALACSSACMFVAFEAIEDSTIRVGLAVSGLFNGFCLYVLFKALTHPPAGVSDAQAEVAREPYDPSP